MFWAVGAYNRLMRLRAEAITAFAGLESELSKQVELVRKHLPPPEATQPAPLEHEGSFWAGLHGAAAQCAASLAAAHNRPLEPQGIAALGAARDVLAMAWERAERDDAHDLAGPRLPDTVNGAAGPAGASDAFGGRAVQPAVARYNAGIVQFPAVLLAWLFGFKPGLGLDAGRCRRRAGAGAVVARELLPLKRPTPGQGSSPALWRLLQAAAEVVQAVRAGHSATAALDRVEARLRPGAQALAFQALRSLGRAEALRQLLARRVPPAPADALLCTALALCWREAEAPYEVFTLVDQAVEAAKRSAAAQGPGRVHQRLPAPLPAGARRARRGDRHGSGGALEPSALVDRAAEERSSATLASDPGGQQFPGADDLARQCPARDAGAVPGVARQRWGSRHRPSAGTAWCWPGPVRCMRCRDSTTAG